MKNGVAGTQSLGFGSRGSGLRCTTDAPLVQDPSDSATLYLGCNNLSRSTNRGASWTAIAPLDALTGPAPADDSATNNPLYAGQFPSISTIAPSKSDPSTIYAGTDNGRLWRTTDLGVTWQEFPNPFAPDPPRWVTSVIVDPLDSNACLRVVRRLPRGLHVRERLRDDRRRRRRHDLEERERQPAERAGQLPRVRPRRTTRSTPRPTSASSSCRTTTRSGRSSATTCRTPLPRTSRSRRRAACSTSAPSAAARGGSRSSRAPRASSKITNTGSIVTDDGDTAKFDGNAKLAGHEPTVKGDESYEVKPRGSAEPIKLKSKELLATTCTLNATPQSATIWGTATVKGSGDFSFRIDVTDAGKHGTNDTYGITTSDGYSSGQQPLETGDIKIDKD